MTTITCVNCSDKLISSDPYNYYHCQVCDFHYLIRENIIIEYYFLLDDYEVDFFSYLSYNETTIYLRNNQTRSNAVIFQHPSIIPLNKDNFYKKLSTLLTFQ